MKKTAGSFFARMRQKFFDWRTNLEIFDRIMPHLQKEKDWGYSFGTEAEMDAQTEQLDAQALLDAIERHASNMPKGYGKAFRHVMHRDLHERLLRYEKVARRRVNRTCDPRFVAVHA
jgi:hypothetical protein